MDIYALNKANAIQQRLKDAERIVEVLTNERRLTQKPIEVLVEFLQQMNNVSSSTKKNELAALCLQTIVKTCEDEIALLKEEFASL